MMTDVYAYLSGDSELRALLGGTSADSRIYPDDAPQGKKGPYIVYHIARDGETDEIVKKSTLRLIAFAPTASANRAISERLSALLDQQDQIQSRIASSSWRYLSMKHINGGSSYEETTMLYAQEMEFSVLAIEL